MPSSSSTALFIEPLDVLILRGNKLFADAGSHGEALMPPWPSVAAGALRSRILIDAGIDPAAFAASRASLAPELSAALGSVARSVDDPAKTNHSNVDGSISILDAARRAGVRREAHFHGR